MHAIIRCGVLFSMFHPTKAPATLGVFRITSLLDQLVSAFGQNETHYKQYSKIVGMKQKKNVFKYVKDPHTSANWALTRVCKVHVDVAYHCPAFSASYQLM